jgi:hypothetical protein
MPRDAATTCDASHDLRTSFQGLEAFTPLTAEDEVELARAFESLFGPAARPRMRTRGMSRSTRTAPTWVSGRPQARRVQSSLIKHATVKTGCRTDSRVLA